MMHVMVFDMDKELRMRFEQSLCFRAALCFTLLLVLGCDRGGWSESIIRVTKASETSTHQLVVHEDDSYTISSTEAFDGSSAQLTGPRKGGTLSRDDIEDLTERLAALDDAKIEDGSGCPEYRVVYEAQRFDTRGCDSVDEVRALDQFLRELYMEGEFLDPSDKEHDERHDWSAP